MPTNYHNTNQLRGDELKNADKRASNQDRWISEFFGRYQLPMTPSAVKRAYDKYFNTDILITSVRRSMSNLSKGEESILVKADIPNTRSPRGGFEGYWKLRTGQGELF